MRDHNLIWSNDLYLFLFGKIIFFFIFVFLGRLQHPHLDQPDRKHVRVAHVKAEFFRRNGIGLPVEQAN